MLGSSSWKLGVGNGWNSLTMQTANRRRQLRRLSPWALDSRERCHNNHQRHYWLKCSYITIASIAATACQDRLTHPQLFHRFAQSITYRLTQATRLVTKKTCRARLSSQKRSIDAYWKCRTGQWDWKCRRDNEECSHVTFCNNNCVDMITAVGHWEVQCSCPFTVILLLLRCSGQQL